MLTEKVVQALNDQVKMEGYASFLYLSMAAWCDRQSLGGCAEFFYRQADEEHQHMMKIINYLLSMDQKAIAPGIEQPPSEFESIKSVFGTVLAHEKKVTASIFDLVELSMKEGDYSTNLFLQWYVEEQREEETMVRSILDKIDLIGEGPQSLYYIDKEVNKVNRSLQAG